MAIAYEKIMLVNPRDKLENAILELPETVVIVEKKIELKHNFNIF